jgi:transposase
MNKFSGIDLHSNNSVVVVSDEADRVVYQRRLPNDPVQIRAALAPHRADLVGVVIEATFNWYWLVDELMNDGYHVHLANPAAIRQYEGLKYSGDFTDAAHLAHLLRLGLLRKATFILQKNVRCGTSRASEGNWCSAERPRSLRSKTCSLAILARRCRVSGSSVWIRRR